MRLIGKHRQARRVIGDLRQSLKYVVKVASENGRKGQDEPVKGF